MRLYNTATRRLDELPAPPGPIRMYFCGPTVYQRIHVGNARPFVVSMWLKRWLEYQDYDVTLVENITDINDKIYLAAPGNSAQLAADAAQWYIEDTEDLGLGRPDHEPKATETIPEIVALIAELIELGLAYPAGGDVYFRVGRFPEYCALGPARRRLCAQPVRGGRADWAEGEPTRLRALERPQGGRGHVVGVAVGTRSPRLAYRVLGDGREAPRACVRNPRRRARPRLPAPRERDRPVARRGA
jgi:hypothetical protein